MNMKNTNDKPGVGIHVRGLRRSYDGKEILKGLSFDVKAGEIFVIMGPSGSGKTVLLKHLIGLEKADSGEILIGGEPVQSPDQMTGYRVAMVIQSGALFDSMTVAENVGFYLTEHRLKSPEEISRILSKTLSLVGLAGVEDKMPSDLSGGMKKRAAIARALVVEPQVLFYDEPTSGLDPLSSMAVADVITVLNHRINVTSIIVTHDRDLAFGLADRIAVIFDGRILSIGTPIQIKRDPNHSVQEFLAANVRHEDNFEDLSCLLEEDLKSMTAVKA
jgi:phospholipid/cholesterol/gamma-HCH transport system ATP-binding protein